MGNIISITSGKGGTGKTTICAGLGHAIALHNKKVLIIELDIGLRALDIMLGLDDKVVYDLGDILNQTCKISDAILQNEKYPNIHFIASPVDISKNFNIDDISKFCLTLKSLYDYIIIDTPAGIGMGCYLSPKVSDITLLVVTPDPICVRDARKMVDLMREYNYQQIRLIINKANRKVIKNKIIKNYDEVIDSVSVQLIGVIPEDFNISLYTFKGEPFDYNSNAGVIFRNISNRLMGYYVPLSVK